MGRTKGGLTFFWKSAALAYCRIKGHHTHNAVAAKCHVAYNTQRTKFSVLVTTFVKDFKVFVQDEEHDENHSDEPAQFYDASSILERGGDDQDLQFFLPPHLHCSVHKLSFITSKDLQRVISQGPT